jgi:iron(III) transport system substrate-binding protein
VDQQPGVSRNFRQISDWLAHGSYPISLGMRAEEVERLKKEGFQVVTLYDATDLPSRMVAGLGAVALMNRAPHPNAAKLFVNWIASREGLDIYSRAYGAPTTRNDIDESFVPAGIIPRPGQKYFDASGWNFVTETEEKVRRRIKEILSR